MAVSGTNISMSSIWSEANTGSTPNDISVSDLFKKSYFQGPNGSATISYNAWGQYGNTNGDDRIYGLITKNNENAWSDFGLLTYFYDNSTYLCEASGSNSKPTASFPNDNDVSIEIFLYDSTYTYLYVSSGVLTSPASSGFNANISDASSPIIAVGYWVVYIQTNDFTGTMNVTININGANYVSSFPLSTNTLHEFDSASFGTADVAFFGAATGLSFTINIT